MASGWLTVDLGNSRAKLRSWTSPSAAHPEARLELEPQRGGPGPELAELLATLAPDARAGLCAVGGSAFELELVEVLEARLGIGAVERPDPGLVNTCEEPHTTGPDRLFAARGALECSRAAGLGPQALVVDAGTALTVDAVRAADDGGAPHFLGGAIAPGPLLLARALGAGTARLPTVEPRVGAPALGRDTRRAIEAGVVTGFRGAARELLARIGEESGLGSAAVVVTGGARRFLLEPEPCLEGTLLVEPELVHRGLLLALAAGAVR